MPATYRAGFGLSAAALLATLTAGNELFALTLTAEEVAAYAHEAEGPAPDRSGDVAAIQAGGVVSRKGAGIHAEISPHHPEEPLYAISLGPLPRPPPVLLSPKAMARIAAADLDRCPDLADFAVSRADLPKAAGLLQAEKCERIAPGLRYSRCPGEHDDAGKRRLRLRQR